MPIALIIEILQGMLLVANQAPEIVALAETALAIAQTGKVTAEQEAAVRAQLDEIHSRIDAA